MPQIRFGGCPIPACPRTHAPDKQTLDLYKKNKRSWVCRDHVMGNCKATFWTCDRGVHIRQEAIDITRRCLLRGIQLPPARYETTVQKWIDDATHALAVTKERTPRVVDDTFEKAPCLDYVRDGKCPRKFCRFNHSMDEATRAQLLPRLSLNKPLKFSAPCRNQINGTCKFMHSPILCQYTHIKCQATLAEARGLLHSGRVMPRLPTVAKEPSQGRIPTGRALTEALKECSPLGAVLSLIVPSAKVDRCCKTEQAHLNSHARFLGSNVPLSDEVQLTLFPIVKEGRWDVIVRAPGAGWHHIEPHKCADEGSTTPKYTLTWKRHIRCPGKEPYRAFSFQHSAAVKTTVKRAEDSGPAATNPKLGICAAEALCAALGEGMPQTLVDLKLISPGTRTSPINLLCKLKNKGFPVPPVFRVRGNKLATLRSPAWNLGGFRVALETEAGDVPDLITVLTPTHKVVLRVRSKIWHKDAHFTVGAPQPGSRLVLSFFNILSEEEKVHNIDAVKDLEEIFQAPDHCDVRLTGCGVEAADLLWMEEEEERAEATLGQQGDEIEKHLRSMEATLTPNIVFQTLTNLVPPPRPCDRRGRRQRRVGANDHERRLLRIDQSIRARQTRIAKNTTRFLTDKWGAYREAMADSIPLELQCTKESAAEYLHSEFDRIEHPQTDVPAFVPRVATTMVDTPFTRDDVRNALRGKRNTASPGADNITYHRLKVACANDYVADKVAWALHTVFTGQAPIPEAWTTIRVRMIPKSEAADVTRVKDFRPIAIGSTVCKLLHAILALRILKHCEQHNIIDKRVQKGFMPKVSGCVDHIMAIHHLLRTSKNKKNLHILLVDIRSAYNCVLHSKL